MARRKSKKYKWSRSDKIFASLYAIGFIGVVVVSVLGASWFAYDTFNVPWADAIYFICLALIYITAFAQEVYDCRKKSSVIANALIFLGSLAILLLSMFVMRALLILSIAHSAAVLIYIGVRGVLTVRAGKKAEVDTKQVICAFCSLLFGMMYVFSFEFVDSAYMVWSLVPTAVLCCILAVAAFFLLRGEWERVLGSSRVQRIGGVILYSIAMFAICFMYSVVGVGLINCSFEREYIQREYTVLDKQIRNGGKTTEREIKIEIDGKEKWIEVPAYDYYTLSEGDGVLVNYYNGTLGFPYWDYAGMTSEQ